MMFYRADGDGNGKVTREELDGVLQARPTAAARASCRSPTSRRRSATPSPARSRPRRPRAGRRRTTLVRGLFRQEIGSLQPGPALGEAAPDFTLKTQRRRAES